jgi:hypothetical protein
MRFPLLRTLRLGAWRCKSSDFDVFTDFIVAHDDTLEVLDLAARDQDSDDDSELPPGFGTSTHLKATSLPHMTTFKGRLSTFRRMVEMRMECLHTTLQYLELDIEGCLVEMMEFLRSLKEGNQMTIFTLTSKSGCGAGSIVVGLH